MSLRYIDDTGDEQYIAGGGGGSGSGNVWTGNTAEYEQAEQQGTIKDGTLVAIDDDETPAYYDPNDFSLTNGILGLSEDVKEKINNISNLDNVAIFPWVEYGHWFAGGITDHTYFRCKEKYTVNGTVHIVNNSTGDLIVLKASDKTSFIRVLSGTETTLNLTEPYLWYYDCVVRPEPIMTDDDVKRILSNIKICVETGTIDNIITTEIEGSVDWLSGNLFDWKKTYLWHGMMYGVEWNVDEQNDKIIVNGTLTGADATELILLDHVMPEWAKRGATYYSNAFSNNDNAILQIYSRNNAGAYTTLVYGRKGRFTIPDDAEVLLIRACVNGDGNTFFNTTIRPCISTYELDSYLVYSKSNVEITDKLDKSADWLKGKNLCDITKVNDGNYWTVEGAHSPLNKKLDILFNANKDYTITVKSDSPYSSPFSVMVPAEQADRVVVYRGTSVTVNFSKPWGIYYEGTIADAFNYVQIEEGNTATPFVPYTKSNVELTEELINATKYDTEEHVIGTWFGKPLYRKGIKFDFAGGDYVILPHGIPNVEFIRVGNGTYGKRVDSTDVWFDIPYYWYADYFFAITIGLTNVLLVSKGGTYTDVYVFAEYTKTTD